MVLRWRRLIAMPPRRSPRPVRRPSDALLAGGRDAGIETALGEALQPARANLAADPQASGYAETALRAAILAGDTQAAWAWVEAGGDKLKIWQLVLAAADTSDPRT